MKKALAGLVVAVALVATGLCGVAAGCEVVAPAHRPVYENLVELVPGEACDLDPAYETKVLYVPDGVGGFLIYVVKVFRGWEA